MKEIGIGVIGTGRIGKEHIRRINQNLSGGRVAAVASSSLERAREAGAGLGVGLALEPEELIRSGEVEAVVVTSPGHTHAALLRLCLEAGKPVFCEKPLAADLGECRELVELESRRERRLIQVGFMRRFDPHHNRLRQAVTSGELGHPLLLHMIHRNPSVGPDFDNVNEIMDAAVHDLDAIPWLLGEDEVISCQVLCGRRSGLITHELQDPVMILLRTASGVLADLEVFTNCRYGFDIGCELVLEQGTISLPQSPSVRIKREGERVEEEFTYWQSRYWSAFDRELQVFIDGARSGAISGPSAWDGLRAAVLGDACLLSLDTGEAAAVGLEEPPAIYAK